MNDEGGELEPKEEVPLTGQCVCACCTAAASAAAIVDARARCMLVRTFRPHLHLPVYHLQARSVCAIFLSTTDYSCID